MHRVSNSFPGTMPLNIHLYNSKAKHGSDTEAYTSSGEFDAKRFDYIFNIYSQPPHNALSFQEGVQMIHGNMNVFDPVGGYNNLVK
jgi:hypothetical protein